MNALEFSVKIEDGVIKLPEQYKEYDNTYARVIVLVDESANKSEQKDKLSAVFKKMEKIKMFRQINNSVVWQKQIRNEWD